MKRRRLVPPPSSFPPKRMVIPSNEQEWTTSCNVYEWDSERFFQETTFTRIPRPLPSSTVLAAASRSTTTTTTTTTMSGLNMPLLQHVQLKQTTQQQQDDDDDDVEESTTTTVVEPIDDARLSTLTRGQHARYRQLSTSADSLTRNERTELTKLKKRITQEQESYQKALQEFWQHHLERFKVGLSSSAARYCAAHAKQYATQYSSEQPRPNKFGPCCQVISLQHVEKKKQSAGLLLDLISSQIVYPSSAAPETTPLVDWKQITSVPTFDESKLPSFTLLDNDDETILEVAKKHEVSIVTSYETLQTLLSTNEQHWMVPMSRTAEGIVVLDVPVPRPTNPRQCVSRGVTQALYQTHNNNDTAASSYTYSLLTLPAKAHSNKCRRVLVRCPTNTRVGVHVQLEYFAERGVWEESTSYERALWILDSKLGHQVMVARVCPETMRVLQWEETGVAHALANMEQDPMHHWEGLVELLHAMDTIQDGKYMLCMGASGISVHKPCDDDDEGVIDLDHEFQQADSVYTGTAALRSCARVWRWNEERVPFTFPIAPMQAKRAKK